MAKASKQSGYIVFLIAGFVLLWNSGFIGAEYGLPYTGPFTLLFWRYLALGLLMLLYLTVRQRLWWPGWAAASSQMTIGILSHGVWLACVLLALYYGVPAGVVALVVALQPLATGAFSGTVTGESTSPAQWAGLVIGFVGVGTTVAFRIDYKSTASIVGHIIPLGSVAAITVASLMQRRIELLQPTHRMSVDLRLFYQSAATALVVMVPAWWAEGFATSWHSEFIYSLTWLTIVVSLGAYALMWELLKLLDATRVASLFYLGPPVTMFMAWVAFGHTLRATDLVGLAIVFAGVLLAQRK